MRQRTQYQPTRKYRPAGFCMDRGIQHEEIRIN